MENKNYHRTITVNATAAEAMKKIKQVNLWWGKNFTGSSEKLNDKFTVRFSDTYFFDFQISELVPNKKVVWKVTDCNMPGYSDKTEWNNTKMVFELSEVKGKTKIDFTHVGLVKEMECYSDCEWGWNYYISESLPKLFKTGKGISSWTV